MNSPNGLKKCKMA